jgi:hypothetical protein
LGAAAFDHATRLDQLAAAQLSGLVGFLQSGLDRFVIGASARNGDRRVEWDASAADGHQEPFLPVLEQIQDALDILRAQAGLLRDGFLVVALIPQLLDAGQQFQGAEFAPGDVLREAHDEGRFVVDVHHHRRNFLLAERLEGLEASFAADEQVVLAIAAGRGVTMMGFFRPMLWMLPTICSNTRLLRSRGLRTSMRSSGIIRRSE